MIFILLCTSSMQNLLNVYLIFIFSLSLFRYFSFLEKCTDAKACTVLLRGGSKDVLNEIERNLQVSPVSLHSHQCFPVIHLNKTLSLMLTADARHPTNYSCFTCPYIKLSSSPSPPPFLPVLRVSGCHASSAQCSVRPSHVARWRGYRASYRSSYQQECERCRR